jgi:hypothetical protein
MTNVSRPFSRSRDRWSREPANPREAALRRDTTRDEGNDLLVLDLSSSSSMPAATPTPPGRTPESSSAAPPTTLPPVAHTPVPAQSAQRCQLSEPVASEGSWRTEAVEEPCLKDVDAGFDALLEQSDRR